MWPKNSELYHAGFFFSCTLSSKDYEPCDAGEVFCLVFGVLCCQRTLNLVIMEKLFLVSCRRRTLNLVMMQKGLSGINNHNNRYL